MLRVLTRSSLLILRYPETIPVSVFLFFAWRCPQGLTASHDIRVAPTSPGTEYAYSIILQWQQGGDMESMEKKLLNLRNLDASCPN